MRIASLQFFTFIPFIDTFGAEYALENKCKISTVSFNSHSSKM